MGKGVQKAHKKLFRLKLRPSLFLLLLFHSPLAFSFTTSLQFSLGMSSYNNNFFLNNNEDSEKTKFITKNLFSPIFKVSWDVYLFKKWRIGVEGAFRTKVNFKTPETTLIEKHSLQLSSSLATSSVEFHILYQVPFDFKNKGYFGLSVGYSEHFLGNWASSLSTTKGKFEQILPPNHHPSFVMKIIAGRDFEILKDFYLDLAFHFSFIETTFTSKEPSTNTFPQNSAGVWSLEAPYQFPSRPLDLTLGLRKNFSF